MECAHEGFHGIRTSYNRGRGLLLYFWTCEGCGKLLRECHREEYTPQFDPRGHEPYLTPAPAR